MKSRKMHHTSGHFAPLQRAHVKVEKAYTAQSLSDNAAGHIGLARGGRGVNGAHVALIMNDVAVVRAGQF